MQIELVFEKEYRSTMEARVLPYLAARRTEARFPLADGASLYYVLYGADAPRGTVVLLHGFTETAEKYDELAYYFLQSGLSVLCPEHRGHGRSYRAIEDTELVHIERFDDYVDDLEALLAALDGQLPAPRYLYCHSMGGAIGAFFAMRHPAYFKKAVLSSPMIAPIRGPLPLWLARRICHLFIRRGRGRDRFFAVKRRNSADSAFLLSCATSRPRFDFYDRKRRAQPQLRGSAPTYHWCYEALGVTERLLHQNAAKILLPMRLYAAQFETIVRRGPQKHFARRLPDCSFLTVRNARHEIFASTDAVLHPHVAELLAFFS